MLSTFKHALAAIVVCLGLSSCGGGMTADGRPSVAPLNGNVDGVRWELGYGRVLNAGGNWVLELRSGKAPRNPCDVRRVRGPETPVIRVFLVALEAQNFRSGPESTSVSVTKKSEGTNSSAAVSAQGQITAVEEETVYGSILINTAEAQVSGSFEATICRP